MSLNSSDFINKNEMAANLILPVGSSIILKVFNSGVFSSKATAQMELVSGNFKITMPPNAEPYETYTFTTPAGSPLDNFMLALKGKVQVRILVPAGGGATTEIGTLRVNTVHSHLKQLVWPKLLAKMSVIMVFLILFISCDCYYWCFGSSFNSRYGHFHESQTHSTFH